MASRALRRAQRERELQSLKLQDPDSGDESDQDDPVARPAKLKASRFAMLSDNGDDDGDDEAEKSSELTQLDNQNDKNPQYSKDEDDSNTKHSIVVSTAKRKKKKKIPKKSNPAHVEDDLKSAQTTSAGLDDIDLALKSLSMPLQKQTDQLQNNARNPAMQELCKLLSIDMHHLNVANEMKRLFGRAAFHVDDEDERNIHRSRTPRPEQPASLSEAVAGRNAAGGAGLAAVLRRRNAFIPGKEDWPRMTGSGLSMEIVKKPSGADVEYTFAHEKSYQHQQEEFELCVRSMDAALMINQLRFNPYHISTLIQVSEIAKQEKDYSTSGDLLERALFAFGRAAQSTFSTNLTQGTARLDFRRPENREFWLAAWRYVTNITMRATWRTGYEWIKLLFSLDPENDPFCTHFIIDQYALRARQAQNFLDLRENIFLSKSWSHLPNIKISTALAFLQLKDDAKAKTALVEAVQSFPWIFSRLYQEMNIDEVPPAIWGHMPLTEWDTLTTEFYVTHAKDLWITPEVKSFLQRTITGITSIGTDQMHNESSITLNEARFIILTDQPHLIALLPSDITSRLESMSDPLPPDDNLRSYESRIPQRSTQISDNSRRMFLDLPIERQIRDSPSEFIWELYYLQAFFERIIPGFNAQVNEMVPSEGQHDDSPVESLYRAYLANMGVADGEVHSRLTRLLALRRALHEEPDSVLRTSNGDEAELMTDGSVRISIHGRPEAFAPPGYTVGSDGEIHRNIDDEVEDNAL